MRPKTFECARCGMAVPVEAERCPSCRARRRRVTVVARSALTGPAAAEAWEARPPGAPPAAAPGAIGDGRSALALGPGAAAAATALRIVAFAGAALAAVQAGRLLLAAVGGEPAALAASDGWQVLADLATVAVAVAAGATMVAVVLVVGWSAVAGLNLRPLRLDPRRWAHGLGRVAGRIGALVALAIAWRWLPGGPGRLDRSLELALAAAVALALVSTAVATRRFVLAVSAAELRQAELLVRRDLASIDRPRGRIAR